MSPAPRNLELAAIGNCEVAALLDDEATIVWCCLPRLDGDPVFFALLDSDREADAHGVFSIELLERTSVTQQYLRNTSIVETTMADAHGYRVRVVDFCPRFRARGRIFRPSMVVRLIEPIAGRPMVRIRVRPRFDNGAIAPEVTRGSHHIAYRGAAHAFRITANCFLNAIADESPCVVDGPLAVILGPDQTVEESPLALANSFLEKTRGYWDDWVRGLAIPFEWQEAVIRAASSLKLCTYEDTGAVLAALTTSVKDS